MNISFNEKLNIAKKEEQEQKLMIRMLRDLK
jgi:hypothetical protein